MSKDEKNMDALLHAVEHPEEYSDDQIEKLMSDSDNREMYNLMVDAENVCQENEVSDEDIDDEWNKISAKGAINHHWTTFRIAAAVIGFVMVSGIVCAAIFINFHQNDSRTIKRVEKMVNKTSVKGIASTEDTAVVTKPEIVEYRDAKLETVVRDMAAYYCKDVSFANDNAKSIRIYIKWNKSESFEEAIDKLNHFEKFTISIEDHKIIVR